MSESPYQAIADPTRRAILDVLKAEGPQKAGDLAERFPRISRPAVSKHLRVLRGARLVAQRKDGREVWYRLEADPLGQVYQWLDQYEDFWRDRLARLKQAVEDEA
jgi:DNA-binding transcriptional ArsR family regulator